MGGRRFLGRPRDRQGRGTWGSAIVSTAPLAPLLSDSSRGSVVVAELSGEGPSIVVANIHARLMPLEGAASSRARSVQRRVIPALTETFAMLGPLLRPPFIVGGDFNTFRSAEQRYPGNGHGRFWAELDEHFYDCHWRLHNAEVGTFWGHVARGHQLQDDHILVDLATGEAGGVESSRVIADGEVRRLSDHGPMEAEVAFP
jgi:endonuclease/exonuclease/phosphatase family metal-dependent hydrolase